MQHDMVRGNMEPVMVNNDLDNRPPQIQAFAELIRNKSECLRGCTQQHIAVCGSDGTSYPNDCVLRERACEQEKNGAKNPVSVLHHGYCTNIGESLYSSQPKHNLRFTSSK